MNSQEFVSDLRRKTKSSASTLTNTQALAVLAEARDNIFAEMRRMGIGSFDRRVYLDLKATNAVVE